jgi:hypothetical protein
MMFVIAGGYGLSLGQWKAVDISILETFFGAFGTIYAIIIGFVIFQVLDYYNQLKSHISSEINAIQNLRDFLAFIDDCDDEVKKTLELIDDYVESIIEDEWPDMLSDQKTNMDTSSALHQIIKSVNAINPQNQSDLVALEKLIQTISEISTHRTHRLKESRMNRLPTLLKQLVIILSSFMILAFTFMPLEDMVVKVIFSSAMTFAVTLIYFVILDLDSAYTGTWAITNERYKELLEENKKYIAIHYGDDEQPSD